MSNRAADAELDAWLGFGQTLRLVSLDPSRNRARVYSLTWQPTLWGEIALVRTWDRLDHPGRSQMTIYPDRNHAQADLRRLLRRRSTSARSPRRLRRPQLAQFDVEAMLRQPPLLRPGAILRRLALVGKMMNHIPIRLLVRHPAPLRLRRTQTV